MRGSLVMTADLAQLVNFETRKPATVARVAGLGSRTGASGASLRGLRGMVRAGEDGGQGKWEEMKSSRQSQPKKRESVRKPSPRKISFYLFSLCIPLKHYIKQNTHS
jgi:hypothetical protein